MNRTLIRRVSALTDLPLAVFRLRADVVESRLGDVGDAAYDLLDRCLDPNPYTRITAAQALEHPFLATS